MIPKFNPSKCKTCIYRAKISGGCGGFIGKRNPSRTSSGIYCNYGFVTGNTCLRYNGTDYASDIRGNDYDDCKLYKKGPSIQLKEDRLIPRR